MKMWACQCTRYTKETKDREHKLYSLFIKYKYMFPYMCVLYSLPFGRSILGDVIWFPGSRKVPD